jgi:hypothetical protein
MGEESVQAVRQPIVLRSAPRRRLDERLLVRFPGIAYALTRALTRLPPTSRIRRATLRYISQRVLEAANRRDWEAAFAILPPEYETHPPEEMVGLGFDPVYRGPEGRLRLQNRWMDELGEFEQEAKEVIDLGHRVVLLGWMRGTGLGSGAAFESELAYVVEFSDGRLRHEHFFRSHAEAFEAAGLSPDRDP